MVVQGATVEEVEMVAQPQEGWVESMMLGAPSVEAADERDGLRRMLMAEVMS